MKFNHFEVEITGEVIKIRVRLPEDFEEDSFVTVPIEGEDGISSVQGKLSGDAGISETELTVQALLFEADKWSKEDAIEWTKENFPEAVGLPQDEPTEGDELLPGEEGSAGPAASPFRSFVKKATAVKGASAYEIIICSSGWTADEGSDEFPARYFHRAAVIEAVAAGMFDGVQCYHMHPDMFDQMQGRREDFACAYIKPGSVKTKENKINGEIDVHGIAIMHTTDPGRNVGAILEASVREEIAMLDNSVVVAADGEEETIDGRPALAFTEFHQISAVDFVEQGAFPRAHVQRAVAANKKHGGHNMNSAAELKAEIARLKGQLKTQGTEIAEFKAEQAVDAMLAKSTISDEAKKVQRPLLLRMDAELRKDAFAQVESDFWKNGKRPAGDGGDKDQGGNGSTDPFAKSSEKGKVFAALTKGVKEEFTKAAIKQAYGKTG